MSSWDRPGLPAGNYSAQHTELSSLCCPHHRECDGENHLNHLQQWKEQAALPSSLGQGTKLTPSTNLEPQICVERRISVFCFSRNVLSEDFFKFMPGLFEKSLQTRKCLPLAVISKPPVQSSKWFVSIMSQFFLQIHSVNVDYLKKIRKR